MKAAPHVLTLAQVVAEFNDSSPIRREKRTVQRWMEKHGIEGFGSSPHNWFYNADKVRAALAHDFPRQRRAA